MQGQVTKLRAIFGFLPPVQKLGKNPALLSCVEYALEMARNAVASNYPRSKKSWKEKGGSKVLNNQPHLSQREDDLVASSNPEVNFKSLYWQLKQKNQQRGTTYQ